MRLKLFFMSCLLLATTVSGQLILDPVVTGSRIHTTEIWRHFGPPYTSILGYGLFTQNPTIYEGTNGYFYHHGSSATSWLRWTRGIIEIDLEQTIDGSEFPPAWMTAYNWTAQLTNLQVIGHTHQQNYNPGVLLYDLVDLQQDGIIAVGDVETGEPIVELYETRVPIGEILSADVTESIRHDLFGPTRFSTAGFVLKSTGPMGGYPGGGFSRELWSENARLRITSTIETPTPTPSPVPTETCTTGVSIWMPKQMYYPGKIFHCVVTVCNDTGFPLAQHPLFVVLDVGGALFFGPSFLPGFDSYLSLYSSYDIGRTEIEVIRAFQWPPDAGSFFGARWYACLTDPDMTCLIGDYDMLEFSWSE